MTRNQYLAAFRRAMRDMKDEMTTSEVVHREAAQIPYWPEDPREDLRPVGDTEFWGDGKFALRFVRHLRKMAKPENATYRVINGDPEHPLVRQGMDMLADRSDKEVMYWARAVLVGSILDAQGAVKAARSPATGGNSYIAVISRLSNIIARLVIIRRRGTLAGLALMPIRRLVLQPCPRVDVLREI